MVFQAMNSYRGSKSFWRTRSLLSFTRSSCS